VDREGRNPYLVGSRNGPVELTILNQQPQTIFVLATLITLCFGGCTLKSDPPVSDGSISGLPTSPTEVNETVCIGVSPDASAWMADPFPIRFPLVDEDAQGGRTDIIVDVTPETSPSAAQEGGGDPLEPEQEEPRDQDPCVAEPGTCLGEPPPEWALLDFQPQSCGSGATYGLSAFHGHVTVMALFASW